MDQQNLKPSVWGPSGWVFLHYVTLSYPTNPTPQVRQNFRTFITSMQSVLPCEMCRTHFKQWIDDNPLDVALTNRDELVKWGFNAHNAVNERNGKPRLDWLEFTRLYYSATPPIMRCNKCPVRKSTDVGRVVGVMFSIIVVLCIGGSVAYVILKRKKQK